MGIEQLQPWTRWLELQMYWSLKKTLRQQRRRKTWVRQRLTRRPLYEKYEQLLQVLHRDDSNGYRHFLRVGADMFVGSVSPRIEKQDTNIKVVFVDSSSDHFMFVAADEGL